MKKLWWTFYIFSIVILYLGFLYIYGEDNFERLLDKTLMKR